MLYFQIICFGRTTKVIVTQLICHFNQSVTYAESHSHIFVFKIYRMYFLKVLAVRNGTLDVHGAHIPVTWTHLASTATAGSTQVTLKLPVTWKAGDTIVIATTEKR